MFQGVYTAITTPFKADGNLDVESLKKLVDFQINGGVSGIVPCGTTGESPTLSEEEHSKVIETVVKLAKGKCQVIAGTGSNSTVHAVHLTKNAEKLGADACLVVSPYYNKPTQEGLYQHFKKIADSTKLPIVVYNIQGRTGVNIETATLMRLAKDCKNIVSVKEASGNLAQMMDVIAQKPANFDVLSGDDNLTLPLMCLGGKGVISVASNIAPKQMVEMCNVALKGNYEKAAELHYQLLPLFKVIFVETNPIPIKAALAMKGIIQEAYRLPLCKMQDANKEKLKKVLQDLKLI